MSLSNPVARRPVHRRTVETQAYRRDDGLRDLEAHLRDTRAFDSQHFHRGLMPAGTPIHDMWVRVTIGTDFIVREVESSSDAAPVPACVAPGEEFAALVGAPLTPGWRERVHSAFGGLRSCTHLVALSEPRRAPIGRRAVPIHVDAPRMA